MAGVPDKVLNWLYSVLPSEYADVDRTFHDVAEALSSYPSFAPRTEVYTYENGAAALLLQLTGTLPVTFRGATYGFPVALWIPHAYPREAPIVYIAPSQDMLVRPGQHVGGDGRVYHPYLAQWVKYWDKSTLFDFFAVLRSVFAKEPPVRAKQQQIPGHSNASPQVPPPVPPPPREEWQRPAHGSQEASSIAASASQAPPPPPKPPKPHDHNMSTSLSLQEERYRRPPPLPPSQGRQYEQAYPPQHSNNGWQSRPPHQMSAHELSSPNTHARPAKPHVYAPGVQRDITSGYDTASPFSPLTPEGQHAGQHPHMQPSSHPTVQHYAQPALHSSIPQHGAAQPQFTQNRGQPSSTIHAQQAQYYGSQPPLQQAPPAPKPPVNLLDDSLAVTLPSQTGNEAPVPVPRVPPNPEKDALLRALSQSICGQIRQTVASNTAAVVPLRGQQAALHMAFSRLQAELEQLQQLDAALASNERILKDTMIEADRVMQHARTRKVPDVDEVLVAPTVVGGQLYALAAEERGIADALFVLGRALDQGRVRADVFVKQTRSLAREQFLKKALAKKIAKGMGLDEVNC